MCVSPICEDVRQIGMATLSSLGHTQQQIASCDTRGCGVGKGRLLLAGGGVFFGGVKSASHSLAPKDDPSSTPIEPPLPIGRMSGSRSFYFE